jgi:hypothetical protein
LIIFASESRYLAGSSAVRVFSSDLLRDLGVDEVTQDDGPVVDAAAAHDRPT